jgi:hypothetical protein
MSRPMSTALARACSRQAAPHGCTLRACFMVLTASSFTRCRNRQSIDPTRVVAVGGIRCADGLQTLIDLSAVLDDDRWEQALESALRKQLCTVGGLEAALP